MSACRKPCFWHHCSLCFNFAGIGLQTPVAVADRPVTQQGLSGMRTGTGKGPQRQYQDKARRQYAHSLEFFQQLCQSLSQRVSAPSEIVCLGRGSLTRMIGIFFLAEGGNSGRRDFLPFSFCSQFRPSLCTMLRRKDKEVFTRHF